MDHRHPRVCRSADPARPCYAARRLQARSIPFERSLFPLVDESDCQDTQKYHHRPEAEPSKPTKGNRPGKEECDLEIKNDEKNSNKVKSYVKLHARVVEGVEATLISGQLLRVRLLVGNDERRNEQCEPNHERDTNKNHQRKIVL